MRTQNRRLSQVENALLVSKTSSEHAQFELNQLRNKMKQDKGAAVRGGQEEGELAETNELKQIVTALQQENKTLVQTIEVMDGGVPPPQPPSAPPLVPNVRDSEDFIELEEKMEASRQEKKSIELEMAALKDRLEIERREAAAAVKEDSQVQSPSPFSIGSEDAWLVITVELGGGGGTRDIEVRYGDDAHRLAVNFCRQEGLSDAAVPSMAEYIKDHIEEEQASIEATEESAN